MAATADRGIREWVSRRVARASLVMSSSLDWPGTLELYHHNNTGIMAAMMKPIDHARCRELEHPDIVNFSVSV